LKLDGLRDFTVFAGLNNSGKSNVLRALNAFFNGVTDAANLVDLDMDYYRPDLRKKKAKRIRVAITFTLPDRFKFRKGLEQVETFLGAREFTIEKTWKRETGLVEFTLNGNALDLDGRQKLQQFLQLVNFRYIPNRVQPVRVIQEEHQALRDVLVRRLGRARKDHSQAFGAIRDTSDKLIQSLVSRLKEAVPDIGEVRLATPSSWDEMLFSFGYKMGQDGIETEDSSQGSGIQSLLMLETLFLIDRDYFQKFGWRQAAIWAVEEPESSLHSSLEARIAAYLAHIASDGESRLQVLATSHSDLMVQYSRCPIIVEKSKWETTCLILADGSKALERLARFGVSRWVHPILHYPAEPIILVEGRFDAGFLEEGFRFIRPNRRVRVTYLDLLTSGSETGGVDALSKYVKANAAAIKARSQDAPVVVVLDWDASNKVDQFKKPFDVADPLTAIAWPDSTFNPTLNKSFRGIERHYSDRMIDEAQSRGATIYCSPQGVRSVVPDEYEEVKRVLNDIVLEGLEKGDVQYAEPFLRTILQKACAT
jgi:predicted ATPase